MAETDSDRIRAVREQAWSEGYEACYRGEQRHNPYRRPKSSTDYVGPYGMGPSQDDR